MFENFTEVISTNQPEGIKEKIKVAISQKRAKKKKAKKMPFTQNHEVQKLEKLAQIITNKCLKAFQGIHFQF